MNAKSLADQLRAAADLIEGNQTVVDQLAGAFYVLFGQHPSGTGGRPARETRRTARPWHKVLGVPAHATETQIKAAYRRLAKRHHPDRGGNKETFLQIKTAYELGMLNYENVET